MADQRGLFDPDERYAALSKAGDPLERLAAVVDFEVFRAELDAALRRSDRAKGGRPPFEAVLMFKVLILQALYGLSDGQAEFRVMDRRTFGRFLGIDEGGRVPDATTIRRFREAPVRAGAVEAPFERFDGHLRSAGHLAMGGRIIDASVVAAPRRRMTHEERRIVKGGGVPQDWKAKPAKLARKGEPWVAIGSRPMANDARWTLKRGRRKRRPDGTLMAEIATPVFGHKPHPGADRRHGFIRTWSVTDAARHDGRELPRLLDRTNTAGGVCPDPADRSAKNEGRIAAAGLVSRIHFRKPPGKAPAAQRQSANAARSKIRSAVEHVFADQKSRMGLFIRTVGLARAKAKIGFANIACNMRRLVFRHTAMAA